MKNKEITMYELIGLIKDGKAPKKVKYKNIYYSWVNNQYVYDIDEDYLFPINNLLDLNDTVEVLLEENDEWKDIYVLADSEEHHFMNRQNGMTQEDRRLLDSNFKTLGDTINQLIKNQKYLKEKLEEK